MMDFSTGSQAFLQNMEELVQRLERLEKIVTLFAVPVLPCKGRLDKEAFHKYLLERCSSEYTDTTKPWRQEYSAFHHKTVAAQIDLGHLSYNAETAQDQLMEHLITIAATEGRSPVRALLAIQPSAFPSAVDALATVAPEET